MEDVPENSKESLHSAHANRMNEWMLWPQSMLPVWVLGHTITINCTVLGTWQSHAEADTLVTF